ncbi:phage tail spike protein [Bacillus sp. FSL R12-0069]|uniref:phage tail spike protein n=1 Tax=Bacillus sp. FSL R12-0069 TaxID=2975342 RepID=UPI0030F4B3EB
MRSATSGELHVVDFKTEQIVASIQPADYWDDKRHWEIKNNIDTLEFRVFDHTRHSSTLMQQNLVLKEVRDGRIVPYVMTEIEKNSDDKSVIAYASGEWIQLAKAGIIPPQKLEGKTVIEMMDIALAGTKWQKGNVEYASFRSMTIDEFIDPLSFLKKIASLFELEIQYRAEVVGSQIVGRYIDMVKKRGQETGKEITLGKDLLGIKRIENSQNICTALLGFVKKEGEGFVTITEINNGVPYLVDNDAFQRWNEKGQHKFGFYSPETENEDMDAKRLMTLMNTELKKRVNSSVSYEVGAQSIGRVFGLAHELINEGDTIRIKDTGFTPKLYLEARVIAGDESFKNPLQDKYIFGDYREIVDPNEELRKVYNRILGSLGNKQEMINQLDQLVKEANETASNAKKESEAAKTLAEKVQENIKNNTVEIIESKNPPTTGLKPFKTLWRDSSNGKPGILKIWTGTAWESVVPDVESVKKETLDQVNKDIETTKTELNQKVQEVQNQATGQFNEVKESLQGVSRTISDVQKEQGNINKKVTQIEQTADGFKQSIESLTKKDNDINNKLNTVESNVEGTKKTISDVQQTTNDLKKTTTEMKEEAGKISTKLEQVDARTVGGENWIIDTGKNQRPKTIGMAGGAVVNKAGSAFSDDYLIVECTDHTDSFYQFHLDQQKIGDFEKNKYMTVSFDLQNEVRVDVILFQFINNSWNESTQKLINSGNWRRESWTFKIDERATGWGLRIRFERNENSKGKKFRFKKAKLEKGSVPTDFSKSTYELEQSVDGVKTTVTNVQNSQSGFEKRMSNAEQTASGLSSTVGNLNNVVSDQGKKLTEANTKLEQQATAIGAKVELKQVENYVAGFKIPELKQTVDKNKQDLLGELANKLATEQYNQKMTQIDNRFSVNEKGIDLSAKKTEVYTQTQSHDKFATNAYVREMEGRIQVTEQNILSTVKKGEVISSINQTAEKVKIQADLIDLIGKVEASWLKAGLLMGMTIKTSNTAEHLHMENQVMRFVNQGSDKMVIGFENEWKSKTRNPYIILGEGDGSGKNFGSIYKDGNGVYYRYVDLNGAESNIRLTNAGNIGVTAQDGLWINSKRTNFSSVIEVPAIRFNSLGTTPGSQQGNFWIGNGYKGFGVYYYDNYWKFVQGS